MSTCDLDQSFLRSTDMNIRQGPARLPDEDAGDIAGCIGAGAGLELPFCSDLEAAFTKTFWAALGEGPTLLVPASGIARCILLENN